MAYTDGNGIESLLVITKFSVQWALNTLKMYYKFIIYTRHKLFNRVNFDKNFSYQNLTKVNIIS